MHAFYLGQACHVDVVCTVEDSCRPCLFWQEVHAAVIKTTPWCAQSRVIAPELDQLTACGLPRHPTAFKAVTRHLLRGRLITFVDVVSAVEEAVDRHRDAVLGRVPLAKAADAIRATARAAAQSTDRMLASESYDENNIDLEDEAEEEAETLSKCAVLHSQCYSLTHHLSRYQLEGRYNACSNGRGRFDTPFKIEHGRRKGSCAILP